MAMRRIFWGFCRNWFFIDSLHYLSSWSDFGFKFAEICVIEKRLADSASWRVGDSPTRRVGESATLRLCQSGSRWLADSASWRVGFWMFQRKLGESGSRRLLDSASRGVANSPTRRAGKSLWSLYSNFLKFIIKLQHFKRLNQHLKGPI